MTELITKIVMSEDAQARLKLQKGLADVEAAQKKLAIALAKGETTNEEYAKSFAKLSKESATLKRALAPLDKEFKEQEKAANAAAAALLKQAKAAEEAAKQTGTLEGQLQARDDKFNQLSTGVGSFGNIQSNLGATSGLASAAGFGKAGQGIALAGEVSALLEELPRLKESFAASGTAIQLVTKEIGLGGLSGSLQSAIPALGATGASIAALTLVALPVVAAIGAITVVMAEMKKNADAAAAAERAGIIVTNTQIETENAYQRMVQSGDIEGIIESREMAWQGLTDNTEQLTAASGRIDELKAQEQALFALRNNAAANLDLVGLAKWNNELGIVQGQIAEQTTNFNNLAATQSELILNTTEADNALANFNETEINVARNAEALDLIQQDLDATEQSRIQTAAQLTQALERVEALDAQRASMIEQRAQQETFAAQSLALESKFANEDQAEQNRELYSEMESIAADGKAKLAQIETDIADLRVERSKALASVESQGRGKIDKLNKDYFSKSISDTNKFRKETERIETDSARARLKLIDDINSRLTAAESDNNVIAFLTAQSDGQKQLKEQAESAATAEQRRVEDFVTAQQEAQVAQQERLAEATAAIEAEKQKVIESFDERRAQLIATRDAEKQAITEATAAAIARYTENEAREAQQADRQRQRDELREQQQDILFQQQLDNIEARKQAELAAVAAIDVALTTLVTKAADLNRQASEITTQSQVPQNSSTIPPFSVGTRTKIRFGGNTPRAYAKGGVIDRPTLALMGEAGPEAVIPLRQSAGLPPSFGRGGAMGGTPVNITVQMPVTVGDVATASMVTREIESAITIVLRDGVGKILTSALYPQAG